METKRVQLPINPAHRNRRLPILLTLEAFIRDIPVASAEGFWNFAAGAADLRKRFNIDLSRHAPRHLKVQIARHSFDLVDGYFTKLEHERHNAYPITDDPRRRLSPGQTSANLLADFPAVAIPQDQSEVPSFVAGLVTVTG